MRYLFFLAQNQRSLPEQFVRGLSTASLQGRAQIVPDPHVNLQHKCDDNLGGLIFFLDGAHSPESMEMCARWFSHAVKEDIQQHNSFKQLPQDSQSTTHGLIQSHTNEEIFSDFYVKNTTKVKPQFINMTLVLFTPIHIATCGWATYK